MYLLKPYFRPRKTPFKQFNPENKRLIQKQSEQLNNKIVPLTEQLQERIELASRYQHQEDLIKGLEQKINLVGENARLRYLLGGANGIKALEVSKLFSIPFVKAMLFNFERSIALNPLYLPAYEAYIESLSMVPSLLGGSLDKARQLANKLMEKDKIQAFFALGFIAASQGEKEQANTLYVKGLELLEQKGFCDQNLTDFFSNSSMNYPYKIAEKSANQQQASQVGLCAINYFIEQYSPFHNLPLEWAYYQKARLLHQLNNSSAAKIAIEKALSINANFNIGKSWKAQHL